MSTSGTYEARMRTFLGPSYATPGERAGAASIAAQADATIARLTAERDAALRDAEIAEAERDEQAHAAVAARAEVEALRELLLEVLSATRW